MSRIGKIPVAIEGNAAVSLSGRTIQVEGGGKKLSFTHQPEISVTVDETENRVIVERSNNSRQAKSLHGLTRSLIANMIEGVTKGFTKELEVSGIGWNARVQGKTVALSVGFADVKEVAVPDDVDVEVQQNRIKVSGADKQKVGQVAAQIRGQRPPEPYNGKGITYLGEQVIRKEGKAFAGGG